MREGIARGRSHPNLAYGNARFRSPRSGRGQITERQGGAGPLSVCWLAFLCAAMPLVAPERLLASMHDGTCLGIDNGLPILLSLSVNDPFLVEPPTRLPMEIATSETFKGGPFLSWPDEFVSEVGLESSSLSYVLRKRLPPLTPDTPDTHHLQDPFPHATILTFANSHCLQPEVRS